MCMSHSSSHPRGNVLMTLSYHSPRTNLAGELRRFCKCFRERRFCMYPPSSRSHSPQELQADTTQTAISATSSSLTATLFTQKSIADASASVDSKHIISKHIAAAELQVAGRFLFFMYRRGILELTWLSQAHGCIVARFVTSGRIS